MDYMALGFDLQAVFCLYMVCLSFLLMPTHAEAKRHPWLHYRHSEKVSARCRS